MNKLDFYKEVSEKSGYNEILIRVVWNHLWKSIKEEYKENPVIDLDNLGMFHLDVKRTKRYMDNGKAEEELEMLFNKAIQNKKLLRLLEYGQKHNV